MLRRAHSLRFILLMTCCSLLSSSLLPVALTGTPPRILATPACPALTYPHTEAMLGALAKAPYACAEDLAAAIRARADSATVRSLITMAHAGADSRARRNALRTLGRLAESPRGSQAHELVVRAYGAATQSLVVAILRSDRDNFLLQDGVWLLDSFFYPSFGAASALEQVATDAGMAAALRYRAAAARARLLFAQPGAVTAADRAFLLNGLRAEDPGVRTAAANAIAYLTPSQFQDAVAVVDGETVLVSSEDVREPCYVRYGWLNFIPFSFYNLAGLPASPFRTDATDNLKPGEENGARP